MSKCIVTYKQNIPEPPSGEAKQGGGGRKRLINRDLVCHIKNTRTHMTRLLLIPENGGLTTKRQNLPLS